MRRRFGVDVILAVLLPVACALALLVLRPDRDQPAGEPPVETPLTAASVVCPAALPGPGADQLGVSTFGADPDAKVAGDVQVGLGDGAAPLRVRSGRVATVPPGSVGPAVVTGTARAGRTGPEKMS